MCNIVNIMRVDDSWLLFNIPQHVYEGLMYRTPCYPSMYFLTFHSMYMRVSCIGHLVILLCTF